MERRGVDGKKKCAIGTLSHRTKRDQFNEHFAIQWNNILKNCLSGACIRLDPRLMAR